MPKRTEEKEVTNEFEEAKTETAQVATDGKKKIVKLSPLQEKAKGFLKDAGLLADLDEMTEREVKGEDGKKDIVFMTLKGGVPSVKDLLYFFATDPLIPKKYGTTRMEIDTAPVDTPIVYFYEEA